MVGAFSRASDAVAAAVAAQQALAAERVAGRRRAAGADGGAHRRGPAPRHSYYLGHALNRCARIRATGHGGQVLRVGGDRGAGRRSPPGAGRHWSISASIGSRISGDRSTSGRWSIRTCRRRSRRCARWTLFRHNLPVQLTPLIGRRPEIVDVRRLLDGERLVTLTGSAGVGKTRLALAVAAEAFDSHPGGVWWVELAPLADPGAVGRAALAALGAREAPGALGRRAARGRARRPAVAARVGQLRAPRRRLRRARRRAAGRQPVDLGAGHQPRAARRARRDHLAGAVAALPDARATRVDVPALSQYDAVVLFVERARRARPSFAVSDANAPAIAEICHRLDGIPLAIELAAARCRQMSAERIATELDDRFRLLTGGARTVLARQQTLAASIDWSHDRLDDAEQIDVPAARRVRRTVPARGRRGRGRRGRRHRPGRGVRPDQPPRRQEPRRRRRRPARRAPLPAAGDPARLRPRPGPCRRRADHSSAMPTPPGGPTGSNPAAPCPPTTSSRRSRSSTPTSRPPSTGASTRPPSRPAPSARRRQAWERSGAGRRRHGRRRPTAHRRQRRARRRCVARPPPGDERSRLRRREDQPRRWRCSSASRRSLLGRGDEYYRGLARWPKERALPTAGRGRTLARERGDRYFEAWATIAARAATWRRTIRRRPPRARSRPRPPRQRAACGRCGRMARLARGGSGRSTGDLAAAIELTTDLLQSAVGVVGRRRPFAELRRAPGRGRGRAPPGGRRRRTGPRSSPGQTVGDNAQHRLGLLRRSTQRRRPRPPATRTRRRARTLWLIAREAIDAGAADVAVEQALCTGATRPPPTALSSPPSRRRHQRRGPLARRPRPRPRPWPAADRRRRARGSRRRRRPRRELGRVPAAPRRRRTTSRRDRLPMAVRLRAASRRRRSHGRHRGTRRPRRRRRRPRAATSTGATPPPTPAAPEANGSDPATAGPASPRPNNRSSPSSPKDSPTRRSPNASSWAEPPSRPTSSTSSPSSASEPAPSSPPKRRGGRPRGGSTPGRHACVGQVPKKC